MTPGRITDLEATISEALDWSSADMTGDSDASAALAELIEIARDAELKLEARWGRCKNCGGQVWQIVVDPPALAATGEGAE